MRSMNDCVSRGEETGEPAGSADDTGMDVTRIDAFSSGQYAHQGKECVTFDPARPGTRFDLSMQSRFIDPTGAVWIVDSVDPLRLSLSDDEIKPFDFTHTPLNLKRKELFLHFHISSNEEHCSLTIVDEQNRTLSLGERAHHYAILTLARQRLADDRRGIEQDSQGWVEMNRLSKMLGLDIAHLNIQIFRARSQIARGFPAGTILPNIVERRRGEVRFGTIRMRIVRGSSIEGEFTPPAAHEDGLVRENPVAPMQSSGTHEATEISGHPLQSR